MKYERKESGLIVPHVTPKEAREKMPRFKTQMFECYYESDVERFKKIVEDKHGFFEGHLHCNNLNNKNQDVNFGKYICIYQYYEPISMEVLC